MSIFNRLSKKLAESQPIEDIPSMEEEAAENKEAASDWLSADEVPAPVFDEEGYDAQGFDAQGFDRSGFDQRGFPCGIGEPLNPVAKLEDEIKKYRRKNGYYEYEMAIFANFPDLKDNFEQNQEEAGDLIYNLFLVDEAYAIRLWKWLLTTFRSTLRLPKNSYRLVSGVLFHLERNGIALARLLPYLKNDAEFAQLLFTESSYADARHASLLAACLVQPDEQKNAQTVEKLAENFSLFEKLAGLLMTNPYLGQTDALPLDKLLKTIIHEIPAPCMTREIYDVLMRCIKKSIKPMMRKALVEMLENNMAYFYQEEKRRKAEEERAARIEQERQKREKELKSHEKDLSERKIQRNSSEKFNELKAEAVSLRKEDPLWEGGRFADFQELAGTMVAAKNGTAIKDLVPGDRLELVREPGNATDPMAISVTDVQGRKIGYISKHSNTLLALLMDSGQNIFGRLYNISQQMTENPQICAELFMEEDVSE